MVLGTEFESTRDYREDYIQVAPRQAVGAGDAGLGTKQHSHASHSRVRQPRDKRKLKTVAWDRAEYRSTVLKNESPRGN